MKLQFKYQKFQADAIFGAFLYDRGNIGEKFVVRREKRNFFRMEQSEDRARIKR